MADFTVTTKIKGADINLFLFDPGDSRPAEQDDSTQPAGLPKLTRKQQQDAADKLVASLVGQRISANRANVTSLHELIDVVDTLIADIP